MKNILYHYNNFCKLLKLTSSIVDTKADEFKKFKVTASIGVIIVVCFYYISIKLKTLSISASLKIVDIIITTFLSCLK